jgi:hypothetical protein
MPLFSLFLVRQLQPSWFESLEWRLGCGLLFSSEFADASHPDSDLVVSPRPVAYSVMQIRFQIQHADRKRRGEWSER